MAQAIVQPVQAIQQSEQHTGQLPFWRQLRWNLVLYFVALAIAPVVVVQVITLLQTSQDARAGVGHQLTSVAEIKTNQLHRWTQEAYSAMDVILADSGRYTKMAGLTSAGSDGTPAQVEINQFLHDTVIAKRTDADRTLNLFKDLSLYDRSGRVIAASDDLLVGRVVNRQPYYEASLQAETLQAPFYA